MHINGTGVKYMHYDNYAKVTCHKFVRLVRLYVTGMVMGLQSMYSILLNKKWIESSLFGSKEFFPL
jgi:hypothetical protein